MPKTNAVPIIRLPNKFRYYCFGCTGRVIYAPEPYEITYAVCPQCGKVHDSSNYKPENWMVMSQEEVQEKQGT